MDNHLSNLQKPSAPISILATLLTICNLIFFVKLLVLFADRKKDVIPFLLDKGWMIFGAIVCFAPIILAIAGSISKNEADKQASAVSAIGMIFSGFFGVSFVLYLAGLASTNYITTVTKVLTILNIVAFCAVALGCLLLYSIGCCCLGCFSGFASQRSANQDQADKFVDMDNFASKNVTFVKGSGKDNELQEKSELLMNEKLGDDRRSVICDGEDKMTILTSEDNVAAGNSSKRKSEVVNGKLNDSTIDGSIVLALT